MKKIHMKHDNKDRVICVSNNDKHKFYYQPVGTKNKIWLFDTKSFSRAVFVFFRKYGRSLDDVGFSMTVKELYEIGNDHNIKINKIINRLPGQIEYVLREYEEQFEMPFVVTKAYHCCHENDSVRAA